MSDTINDYLLKIKPMFYYLLDGFLGDEEGCTTSTVINFLQRRLF